MNFITCLCNKIETIYEKYQFVFKLVTILCISLVVVLYGKYRIQKDVRYEDIFHNASQNNISVLLKNGDIIEQEFSIPENGIDTIGFRFVTYGTTVTDGSIEITISDTKQKVLYKQTMEANTIKDNEYLDITLDAQREFEAYENYIVQLKFEDIQEQHISCYLSDNNIYDESLKINDMENVADLVMHYQIIGNDIFESMYLILCICVVILITVVYIFVYKKQIEWRFVYLFLGIGLGLLYMIIIPIYAVPDETTHLYATYEVSNKILGIENTEDGSLYMRKDDEESIIRPVNIDRNYYNLYYKECTNVFIDHDELVATNHVPIDTTSYSYWISAIGLTIGRLFHLNTIPAFMLGRLFNMAFFIACVYYGIKKIPFGKIVMLIWAILPMTLQQAGSYSYDVLILAMSSVIVSLSLKLAYEEETKKSEWIILFIAGMLMVPVKQFAIIPLSLVPIIICFKKWRNNKFVLYYTLGLVVSIIVIVALVKISSILTDTSVANETGKHIIEWANEEGYTLGYLLRNPKDLLYIICNTIYNRGEFYFGSTLGNRLGWLEFNMPLVIVMPYFILLIIAAMRKKDEPLYLGRKIKVYLCFLAALGIGFVCAGMLLQWTPITYDSIEGVQGRYFLPFLVMLMLCIRSDKIEVEKQVDKKVVFASVWLELLIIVSILISIL